MKQKRQYLQKHLKFLLYSTKQYIMKIIHQDELYFASSTIQEIIHIMKDKYKIKINPKIINDLVFPMIQEEQ